MEWDGMAWHWTCADYPPARPTGLVRFPLVRRHALQRPWFARPLAANLDGRPAWKIALQRRPLPATEWHSRRASPHRSPRNRAPHRALH
jgi:hypothetical protein